MRNSRVYIFCIFCFAIGFIIPIVVPLLRRDDTIVLSLSPKKYEKKFLRTPSVALLDSINDNTLSCFCNDHEYDNLIYYWILKDSSFYRPDTNETVLFHHTILNFFTDSTQYYSPNEEMLEFSIVVGDVLQNRR